MRIGTLHDEQVLVVHHVFRPDDSFQTLDVGTLLPAHATALGKVLLAHHPYVASALAAAGLEEFTPRRSPIPTGSSESWLGSGRRAGRQTSASWCPVRSPTPRRSVDRRGMTVGAMGIFGPPERLLAARQPRGDLLAYVREGARAVSRELGAIPW